MHLHFRGWSCKATAIAVVLGFVAVIQLISPAASAQTSATGAINGTVVDSTGAVVSGAVITLKDEATGATQNFTANAEGRFIAPYLKPDKFDVSATSPGLQSVTTTVQVLTGQQSAVNVTVTPTASTQTVQVSANNAQLIDTQSSNTTTTFTTSQFQNLPAPGGDITTIAYTIPGVVVGAGTMGFGAISSDGLPGLSNLVIVNGTDYNVSLYGGVNYSGSSNLTLGQQEIAQASVVQNGYSTQYGRQAGIIETYATKSGTNRVHGLLQYDYNSSGLNANDFFNNLNGVPKSKAVSNQYAAQIGGPIKHDKLFFFADTEGIRFLLPDTGFVNLPSKALQASVLANPAITAASKALYGTMFASSNASPAFGTTVPVVTGAGSLQDKSGTFGCGSLAGTPDYATGGTLGTSAAESCLNSAFVNATGLNKEYLVAGRIDWNVSSKHLIFFRVTDDQGQQPTLVSLINPLWDIGSNQPSYTGQMNDTYSFTPNLTNQFIVGALYYSGIFGPPNIPASLASSPTEFNQGSDGGTNSLIGVGQSSFFAGATTLGTIWDDFPAGVNATQYQVVDGLSWLKGNHNFKFGLDFARYDLTDTVLQTVAYGGFYGFSQMADEFGGSLPGPSGSSTFTQGFPRAGLSNLYDAVYNLGIYAQDEWRVKPNFVFDYGIRFDRNGNPACVNNCFSQYLGGFPDASATLDTPYDATVSYGHRSAFPSIEPAVVQPRAGFNWDTRGDGKTVLRGGVGLFSDQFPGLILEQAQSGFPNRYFAGVGSGTVAEGPGSAQAVAAGSAAAVLNGFSEGATYNQINAEVLASTGYPFQSPDFAITPQKFHSARYLEYSMQLQQQFTPTDAVIVSYAGNHGYDLFMPVNNFNQSIGATPYSTSGFDGLPQTSPDARFSTVQGFTTNAISNYNGLSVEYKHIDRRGLTTNISYTWSHALDDISNGGNSQLPYSTSSIGFQITPNSPSRLMYSNSDYDIRHNFVMDLVYVEPNHFSNKLIDFAAAGWTVGAKAYWRSGEPFSVFNVDAGNALGANATGGAIVLADVLNNNFNHHCTSFSRPCFQTPGIFNGAGPGDAGVVQTNFGNVPRNAFSGPHYADVDINLYKDIFKRNSMAFQVGAQAYNVLNRVNFGQPGSNASSPNTLGVISSDIGPPTSPYGSSQSASLVSGRILVVQGRLVF